MLPDDKKMDDTDNNAMTKILIVEDEAVVVLDLNETLTDLGYTIMGEAFSGEDALSIVSAEPPDLIMMDIVLGGQLDGIETAQKLRQFYHRPIIFLTSYSDKQTVERIKQVREPYNYIRKPFDEEILRVIIELALYKYEAEQKLSAQSRLLETTMRSIGDGVITTDEKGRVVFINRVAEQLTGWTLEDARGEQFTTVFDIINENTRLPAFNPITRVLEEGVILGLANHTIAISRDGRETPIDDSAAPIVTASGEILGAVIVFRDITARREAEMVLRQAQRLDSLGVLAGGVAHDFNNLLTGILAQSSLLMAQLPDDSWELKRVKKIVISAEHAADLTANLLDYAGKGMVERTMVEFNSFVADNLAFLRTVLPGEIAIQLVQSNEPLEIYTDENQIKQVLVNLTRNAWQAINTMDGVIKIRTDLFDLSEEECENYLSKEPLEAGQYALLEVSDNGIGMDSVTRERIFDPFFSTQNSGRGLGLTAILGIIYRNSGGIQVRSQINVGTTFTMLFPLNSVVDKYHVLEEVKQVNKSPNFDETVILVVDDQDAIRDAVVDILEATQAKVHVASNGLDAIAQYNQYKDEITLVLLDIQMPGMGGLAVLETLQSDNPDVSVILSSGYSDTSYKEAIENPNVTFLHKPYRYHELVEAISARLVS